jgi:hypothetical protein
LAEDVGQLTMDRAVEALRRPKRIQQRHVCRHSDTAGRIVPSSPRRDQRFSVRYADDQRCFSVVDGESKATDAGADVMVNVSSYQDMSMGGDQKVITVFGKMLMKYKKNGDKWTLDSIEPKDLITKTLTMDQFKQWLDIQMPNCKYSRYVK